MMLPVIDSDAGSHRNTTPRATSSGRHCVLSGSTAALGARPVAAATVLMGHVPLREAQDLGHLVALDTGAGLWPARGRLSALVLPERRVVSVDARWRVP